MEKLEFIFEMPNTEELASFISIKGEKGETGDVSDVVVNGKSLVKNSVADVTEIFEIINVNTGTNISAKTVEGGCKVRKIYGDLSQKVTVQGKNICPTDISYWESGHYGTTGVKEDNVARIRLKKLLKVEPDNTYYLSTNFENYLFVIRTYDSTGTFVGSIGAVQNGISFTTGATVNYLSIAIYKAGANMNDETYDKFKSYFANGSLKPFICLNSVTDKTYEEFSPDSPSPDYPSDIEVVGDNVNLFDKDNIIIGKNINSTTGNIEESNVYSVTDFIKISNKNITISFDGKKSNYNKMSVGEYDENYNFIKRQTNDDTTLLQHTFSLSDNTRYIKYSYRNDVGITNIKIEQGTVATGYTNYGVGGIDYKTNNKNLYNKNRAVKGFYYNSKGELATSENWYYENIKVAPNTTYVISGKTLDNTTAQFVEFDKNMNFVNCIGNYKVVSTFTTTDKTAYVGLSIPYYGENSNDLKTLQFELGDKTTEYVENQEKNIVVELPQGEFLAKINDIEDYIDNKGVLHKYIGKKVLDGTEEMYFATTKEITQVFGVSLPNSINSSSLTSHFPSNLSGDIENSIILENVIFIAINKDRLSENSIDGFKSYLAEQYANGTPITIYYVLATPYEVNFKYNNILPQYEEMTNISCSAISEIETTTSPAIASVNDTLGKIQENLKSCT